MLRLNIFRRNNARLSFIKRWAAGLNKLEAGLNRGSWVCLRLIAARSIWCVQ